MKVGVLALQGDVPEHLRALAQVVPGAVPLAVRRPEDLAAADVLFLPGGESTTIARLLQQARLWEPLAGRLKDGFPVLATCAGFILLATSLSPGASGIDPPTFGALEVTIRRNDYGAQRESFEGPVRVEGLSGPPFPGVFIRAPRILAVGPRATSFAWQEHEVVGVRRGSIWGLTFHPELSGDLRLHKMFLAAVQRGATVRSTTRGRPPR